MRTAALALLSVSLTANAAVITFEEFATGSQTSTFLASYGISSVTEANGTTPYAPFGVGNQAQVNAHSGSQYLALTGSWWPYYGQHSTTFVFASPVTYFSFWVPGNDQQFPAMAYAGWKAEAFDQVNSLVDSVDSNYATGGSGLTVPLNAVQHTLDGAALISRVVFSMNYSGYSNIGTVYVDDFAFEAVPEPRSAALFSAAALIGLLLRQRSVRR